MEETIESFWIRFNEHAQRASSGGPPVLFRGVSDESYTLTPSIGRNTYDNTGGDIEDLESLLMEEFKRLSVPVLNQYPKCEFEWLFLAQHYGLPTRLLDWSTNPLVALFFAVDGDDEKDAALYVVSHLVSDEYELFDYKTANIADKEKRGNPMLRVFAVQPGQGEVVFIRPKYTDQRYLNQKSVFSCHANPFKPLELAGQCKLTINKEWKHEIRKRLRVLGISHSYIYPGLGGVAQEVKEKHYSPIQKGQMIMRSSVCEIPAAVFSRSPI